MPAGRVPDARKPRPADAASRRSGGGRASGRDGHSHDGFSTRQVADVLGLPTSRILGWARRGLVNPHRGDDGVYVFSFQDVALLRRVRELLEEDLPPRRLRAALDALRDQLPVGRPLSALDLAVQGRRIVVRDGDASWEPDTGQLRLDFEAGPAAGEATRGDAAPGQTARPGACGADADAAGEDAADEVVRAKTARVVSLRRHALLDEPPGPLADPEIDAEGADEWYDAALELETTDPPGAEAAYRRAVALDPRHADAHLNLGRLLHERGLVTEAELQYRRAVDADPRAGRAWFNLGVAVEDLGRRDEAMRAYERALKLDDDLAAAHFNLSRLLDERGLRAKALRHLAKYRRLERLPPGLDA